MNTYKEKVIALLKSQELSQEQKEKLESIFPELAESEESKDEKIRKEMLVYFKSLKGQHQLFPNEWIDFIEKQGEQKYSEWSEEDENLLKLSLENLTELKDRFGEEYGKVGDCINWLKSLRPQSRWKPSDEQMDALESAIVDSISSIQKHSLESLYNELKKLF